MNQVRIALNICTYKREQNLKAILEVLKKSEFFNSSNFHYFNKLHIFVVDNASELTLEDFPNLHLFYNPNTGGSGGFQRGIEEIRKINDFTHVIFMDDDVKFEISSFYILYDFLENVDAGNADRPIAGRMFDIDNPNIQWTAAERWNSGVIQHVEFLRDISNPDNPYTPGKVIYDTDADYGGFWFCCYPYQFVLKNDIIPFFLHCDDVEYGLRCTRRPLIIEGVHVWHKTWEKKINSAFVYYDYRNTLFVNSLYNHLLKIKDLESEFFQKISEYHICKEYLNEYMIIIAMRDFLRGKKWLYRVDACKYHNKISNVKTNKVKNAITWRCVMLRMKLKYFYLK